MNNEMDDFSAAPVSPITLVCLVMKPIKLNLLKTSKFHDTNYRIQRRKTLFLTGAQGGSRIITAALQVILNFMNTVYRLKKV